MANVATPPLPHHINYFNDNEPYVAQWVRNLYPTDYVDERGIEALEGSDFDGYDRVHLFSGIGGWEYALSLAGWPATVPVWTGSCPCQPYSSAGRRGGDADPRNLWPHMHRLIRECRPQYVFGEQVASAVGHGWLDGVFADLEGEGYTCGAAVLGAHSVGAPHIRQRLYWVAYTPSIRLAGRGSTTPAPLQGDSTLRAGEHPLTGHPGELQGRPQGHSRTGGLADAERDGLNGSRDTGQGWWAEPSDGGDTGRLGNTESEQVGGAGQSWLLRNASAWTDAELLYCLDGRTRRTRPGLFPLAHGVPSRVPKLRAIGNSIVPQTAAVFVRAFMESVIE